MLWRSLDNHAYIIMTLVFATYSQLVVKWRVNLAGELPAGMEERIRFILQLLFTPWIISAMLAVFCSAITWVMAMTRFELSYALPFTSLILVIVTVLSVVLFNESLSSSKVLGTLCVIIGVALVGRG